MVINYKCPSCGSDMKYNADTGEINCDSCGRKDDIESFPRENIEREFDEKEVVEYKCKSCGANLLTDEHTSAIDCSFCGSSMIIGDRLSGKLAPSKVIPFKISKEKAQEAFKKWAGNGRLTPKGFMTGDRIKNISGMYLPFWLYDLNTNAEFTGIGTKVRVYMVGDYEYTETSFYDFHREVDLSYLKVPKGASKKVDEELMEKIEPFNYDELKEFNMPYLAGYTAEKYNMSEKELLPKVKSRIDGYVKNYIDGTTSQYVTSNIKNSKIDTVDKNIYYTLLPVWLVYYDYKGQEYIFLMNGQTGKVVGKPPLSNKKIFLWLIGIFFGVFLLFNLLSFMIGGVLW